MRKEELRIMEGRQPAGVSTYDVAFGKPWFYRFGFIAAFIMVAVAIIAEIVFSGLAPASIDGEDNIRTMELDVTDASAMPITVEISHDFPIATSGSSFAVSEGPDAVNYNLTFTDSSGKNVQSILGTLSVPLFISIRYSEHEYYRKDSRDIELRPGRYTVYLQADHPVQYKVTQTSRYAPVVSSMAALAVLGIIIIIGLALAAKSRAREVRGRLRVAAYSATDSSADFWNASPRPMYDPRPHAGYGGYPHQGMFQCPRCGNLMRGPPVEGIVRCEHCGNREYV
jgi:hypothetical protein